MTRIPAWMIGLPNHDGRVLVPLDPHGVATAESVLGIGFGDDHHRMLHPHAAVEVDEMVLNSVRDDRWPGKKA